MPVRMEENKAQDSIKEAADILMRAEEIKANKDLMGHIKLELKKKGKIIDSLDKLRAAAENFKEDVDEEEDVEEVDDEEDGDGEPEPKIEEETEDGVVLESPDESKIQIAGPRNKVIYTKEK